MFVHVMVEWAVHSLPDTFKSHLFCWQKEFVGALHLEAFSARLRAIFVN
jgi:hypothetical protein